MEEYFTYIEKLMNECDRRFSDADLKVCEYIISRLKSSHSSLTLLKIAKSDGNKEIETVKLEDIQCLIKNIKEIMECWREKKEELKKSGCERKNHVGAADFSKYKANQNNTGLKGRPSFQINIEFVKSLLEFSFNMCDIATIIGVSRTTLWRHMQKAGGELKSKYSNISGQMLDDLVKEFKREHSLSGERMVIGFLRSKGIHIQRAKVRESIHRVDPLNAALRWLRSNPRWIYSVPGPNSLWHNDGLHKLVHWGLYVHACIDGYSRMVTSIVCADNNKAATALEAFLGGVEEFGLPARVRGDCGTENNFIEKYMLDQQNYNGAYIRGPSVHNQRIERLHYDTTHCVLSHFIDLFLSLEENSLLDRNNVVDLISLQFVFIPRIQKSLNTFKNVWNHHSLSTECNKTPFQLWTIGMMDSKKSLQRGVRTYIDKINNENLATYGVDVNSVDGFVDETVEFMEPVSFTELKLKINSSLQTEFEPLEEDQNFGIEIYVNVKVKVAAMIDE